MNDNTILIKNALILSPNNNFENNEQSLLIKGNIISEISEDIDDSEGEGMTI